MRRALGIAGMILAVIGMLLCLGMTVGAWYGRYAVNAAVAQAIPVVDDAITAQTDFLTRLDSTLNGANADIGSARARIGAIVDESASGVRTVVDSVSDTVERILTPVRGFRATMAALRGSIMLFATFYNALPSVLNLPEIPTEGLEQLEVRARAIEEQVAAIEHVIANAGQTLIDARAQADAVLDSLQNGITTISESAAAANTLLRDFQRGLPALQARVNAVGTWLALLATLLALCGAALFVNLFYNARVQWDLGGLDWVKSRSTTTTTETRTEALENGERMTTTVTVIESKVNRRAEELAA